jgi:hypothetical protein
MTFYQYTSTADSPEEREIKRRQSTFKRVKFMGAILLISVIAKIFIKPPPPPKTPDRSKQTIRYVPGMLDQLPPSALEKMDPKILAQIRAEEMRQKNGGFESNETASNNNYQPSQVPLDNMMELEAHKQREFSYIKKMQLKQKVIKEEKHEKNHHHK